MSSGDHAAADTDDLDVFVDRGAGYVRTLGELFERIVATRSDTLDSVSGADAAPPPALAAKGSAAAGGDPFAELLAEATNNNTYVLQIRNALMAYSGRSGEVEAPEAVVWAAIEQVGLDDPTDLDLEADQALADQADANRLFALGQLIDLARSQGHSEMAVQLEEERQDLLLDQVDPELAHTVVFTRNFDGMFDDGKIQSEHIQAVSDGEREEAVYEWLASEGITGEAADLRYLRIVDAARFFVDDADALDRLDAGNDPVSEGGGPDGDFSVGDGIVNAMSMTAPPPASGAAAAGLDALSVSAARELRDQVIEGHVAGDLGSNPLDDAVDLAETYEGDSILGRLNPTDQQVLVDAFVTVQTGALLNPDPPEMMLAHPDSGNDEVDWMLREGYADRAVLLEVLGPTDPRSQAAAALLSGHSLWDLDSSDQARLVSGMTEPVPLSGGGSISRAGVFAAALVIPDDVPVDDEVWQYWGAEPNIRAARLASSALAGLNDAAGDGDFSAAESDFVFQLLEHMPDRYGFSHWTEDGERYLGEELGLAVGRAAYPGDDSAQSFHGDRLSQIFMTAEGELLASNNDIVDPDTRRLLLDTLVFGREPNVPDNPHDLVGQPDSVFERTVFWDVDDVTHNESERVIADLAVDTGRAQLALEGRTLTFAEELHIRRLAGGTDHGRDLAGFNRRVDFAFRNQFVGFLLDNPEWSADDFSGGGSGFDNPLVNTEYAVVLAEAGQLGEPLDADELARIREIGGSDEWIDRAGLGADLEPGMGDGIRAGYLAGAIDQEWTSDTFGLTDDIALNVPINHWLAQGHLGQFDDPARSAELEALADGETRAYVDAVLDHALADGLVGAGSGAFGEGPLHPALRGRIDSTIAEIDNHRADGASIHAIPVFLNTGGVQAGTYLFETTNDAGDKVYIDLAGEHFDSVSDWYNHSRLPPGRVVFTGTTDGNTSNTEFVSPLDGSGADARDLSFTTESYVDTVWEHAEPWVVGGVALVGGVVFFVNPVAGGLILGGVGTYQAAKGATGLYQIHQHGGEFDWSDPRVRGDVLNLGEGVLTVATAGGGAWAARSARAGNSLAPRVATGLQGLNVAEGVYSAGVVGYQVNQILASDLPGPEKARLLAQMGFVLTAQGVAPIAIGRGLHNLPFTTANAYHAGITPEAFEAAQAAGLTDPLDIAMHAYLTDARHGVLVGPGLDRHTGALRVGPAVAVAGHNVGGVPFLSGVPTRLVSPKGEPTGNLNPPPGVSTDGAGLANLSTRHTVPLVLADGTVIQQPAAVIAGPRRLQEYLKRLDLLYEASGTPLTDDVRRSIETYIESNAVVGDNGAVEYVIPTNQYDLTEGSVVSGGEYYPGTHADVVAVNEALANAQAIDGSATLADITLQVHRRRGGHLASCPHCSGILTDVEIVSGTSVGGVGGDQ